MNKRAEIDAGIDQLLRTADIARANGVPVPQISFSPESTDEVSGWRVGQAGTFVIVVTCLDTEARFRTFKPFQGEEVPHDRGAIDCLLKIANESSQVRNYFKLQEAIKDVKHGHHETPSP